MVSFVESSVKLFNYKGKKRGKSILEEEKAMFLLENNSRKEESTVKACL